MIALISLISEYDLSKQKMSMIDNISRSRKAELFKNVLGLTEVFRRTFQMFVVLGGNWVAFLLSNGCPLRFRNIDLFRFKTWVSILYKNNSFVISKSNY